MTDPARWTTIRVLPGQDREAVLGTLFAHGVQGVHEAGDELITHVPESTDVEALVCAVLDASAGARVATAPTPKADWSEAWKRGVRAHTLGSLTIAPPWLAERLDPRRTVVIEPAMAFGTGEHSTTRGVIRLLQRVMRAGDRVADVGAGSAVLAIAAAKLGAAHATAIEIDPDAIENAEANVRRNEVANRVTVVEGDARWLLPLAGPFDVIIANILSGTILELLPAFDRALEEGGRAIFSGILVSERGDMTDALEGDGWRILHDDVEDIWWTAAAARQ